MINEYANLREPEINLVDMLCCVLKRWRIILIGMVVGAALMGGYAYISNNKTISVNMNNSADNSEDDSSKIMVAAYQSVLSENQKYLKESIYLNMDPSNVQVLEETYFVSSDKGNTTAIIKSLRTIVKGDDFCTKVSEAVGEDIKEQYLNELISFELSVDSSYDMGTVNKLNDYSNICQIIDGQSDAAFSVKIKGRDKAFCEKVGKCFDSIVKESSADMYLKLGNFNIKKISSVFYKQYENNIISQKRSILAQILGDTATLQQQEKTLKSSLDVQQSASSVSIVKYILIGAISGIFLVCVFYAVIYICSGKLRTADDIEIMYGMQVFRVDNEQAVKGLHGIDRLILNMQRRGYHYYDEDSLAYMVNTLILVADADKERKHKLFISAFSPGVVQSMQEDGVMRSMADKLIGMGIEVQIGSNPAYDVKSLEYLNNSDLVLFVEGISKSAYIDIGNKVKCIKEYDTPIIGCVVI